MGTLAHDDKHFCEQENVETNAKFSEKLSLFSPSNTVQLKMKVKNKEEWSLGRIFFWSLYDKQMKTE